MSSVRPAAVKWIVGLTWVRMSLSIIAIGIALLFLSPMESEMGESFRRGWVRASGFSVEDYGPEQAGQVTGVALVPLILSALTLTFVRRRKLRALRIAAAVNAIMSWAQPLVWPLTVTALVLAYRKSTAEYFERQSRTGASAAQGTLMTP